MTTLPTVSAVIEALGGVHAVKRLVGSRTSTRIHNWAADEQFPAHTYVLLKGELRRRRMTAPDALWKMTTKKQPRTRRAAVGRG